MNTETKIAGISNTTASGTEDATKKSQESGVPDNLKRFEVEGKLDVNKLATSFLSLEKEYHKTSQERAALSKSYEVLANKVSSGKPTEEDDISTREKILEKPAEYVTGIAKETLETMGKPIVDALIGVIHPEVGKNSDGSYKNPEFIAGFSEYIRTFPENVRLGLANFRGADWAIKQYKSLLDKSSNTTDKEPGSPNSETKNNRFSENPSNSSGASKGGKLWTRKEVRDLMQNNPTEYAKMANEISSAMDEGRYEI